MDGTVMPSLYSLSPYKSHSNLLFQFVLAEFLSSYSLVKQVEQSILTEGISTKSLLQLLGALGGNHSLLPLGAFSWNPYEGHMAKLNDHCIRLIQTMQGENKPFFSLHRHADKSFLHCLQCLNSLEIPRERNSAPFLNSQREMTSSYFQQRGCTRIPADRRHHSQKGEYDREKELHWRVYAKKMTSSFHRLAAALPIAIFCFRADENVLYFLLRSSTHFDLLYRPGFTADLLNQCSPEGLVGIKKLLLKAYSTRGFTHLVPAIQNAFNKLLPS